MPYLDKKLLTLILLVLAARSSASALFDEDQVLEMNLTGPLSTLIEAGDDRAELPFVLYADDIEHAVKVRVRGKSRTRVCSFPPLRINFAKGQSSGSLFAGQDKLKLVTHCQNRNSSQASALKEYVAYKIFNLVSPVSFNVRLVHITYSDSSQQNDFETIDRYGFLIESVAELAERVDGEEAALPAVSLSSLNEPQAAAVYIFQYLIGNTDWSLVTGDGDETCCHNGELIKIGPQNYYVPFDFDLAGLVNARYAKPDPSLRISKVTQRVYRGFCLSSNLLKDTLDNINAQKEAILGVIDEVPGLSTRDVDTAQKFLNKFFDQANDEEKLIGQFERRCL